MTGTAGAPDARLLATPGRRRLLFAALYFAEGAPIGFVWWALPVWLRTAGVSPGDIALLMATVAWPWALKFVWAPLVDLLRGPRFGLRGWILTSQAAMALALVPLLFVDVGSETGLLMVLLLAHALAAATQDAAIDTLAIHTVAPRERGVINGWMQLGMLAARGVFGGGAVLLAARAGERLVVAGLIAAIALPGMLVALGVRDPDDRAHTSRGERLRSYRAALIGILGTRQLWAGLVFASLAGAGFESLASLAGPLLIDRGASEDTVGVFFLVPTVVLMAVGALLGGRLADRFGRRRVTGVGEALAALAVLSVGVVAATPPSDAGHGLLLTLLGLMYFAAGVATAALYGLLMDLVDRTLAATQFCAFMAGINLCYVWSTRVLGALTDRWGYGPAITALGLASLASLPLLALLRPAPARTPSADTPG